MPKKVKQESIGLHKIVKALDDFKSKLAKEDAIKIETLKKDLVSKAESLTPVQMEKELRNVIRQLKVQPVNKEVMELKSKAIIAIMREADELKRQVKHEKKSQVVPAAHSALAA